MRVASDYYNKYYIEPEVCSRISTFCRALRLQNGTAAYHVGKRLTSIISRYYSKKARSSIRLYGPWVNEPHLFVEWFLEQDPTGRGRMMRKDVTKDFEPSNLTIIS